MVRYRMLAIDIDGTLLDGRGRIPEANLHAMHAAEKAGILVVLCTGRGWAETRPLAREINHRGPLVLACGAHVVDPDTGHTLHRRPLQSGLAHDLVHHFDHSRFAVLVLPDPQMTDHDYLIVASHNMTDNTRWWFNRIEARIRYEDRPTPDDLQHALRIAIVGCGSQMPPIQESIRSRFGQQVNVQHFAAIQQDGGMLHLLEVFNAGVDKWTGLQWLAGRHGIREDQIAAIGDQINDEAMIRHAACGIAMGNAAQPILKIADRITTTNEQAGVAAAIAAILAGKW